jgi:hypothetical protein
MLAVARPPGRGGRRRIGDRSEPWVYLADPVDGTRLWLTGKLSAWVLLGAGREATTLEELEVGAAVELPRHARGLALSRGLARVVTRTPRTTTWLQAAHRYHTR